MTTEKKTCCAKVYRGMWSRDNRCSRPGSIERKGQLFCKQHDPVRIAEERRKKEEQYERERKEREANRCPYCYGTGRKHA